MLPSDSRVKVILDKLNRNNTRELAAFKVPPPKVVKMAEVILIIMRDEPRVRGDVWREFRKVASAPAGLHGALAAFPRASASSIAAVGNLMQQDDLSPAALANCSAAASILAEYA